MELDILTVVRYLLCNVVINFVMFSFFNKMYRARYDNKWIYLFSYVAVVIARIGIACMGIPPINMISSLIIINLISVLLYQCTLRKCILYNFSFMLMSLFADIVGTSLVSVIVGNTIEEVFANHFYKYIGSLFNCVIHILFSRWLVYFFIKDERSALRTKEILFLTAITVLEVLIIRYATNNILNEISGVYLIFLSCGFLFINLYVVYLIEQVTQIGKLQKDLSLAKQHSELQLKYYQAFKDNQELSRKAVHDAKKHLHTIEGLYNNGCKVEAIDYGILLKSELDKLSWGVTYKNKILETIIGSKLEQANRLAIKFIPDVQDIDIGFIADLDITAIFANLLDNSFEACLELEVDKRIIEMHMIRHNNFVVLNISNPISSAVNQEGRTIKTTKVGHSGIGLSNVLSAVNKYEGSFIACVENKNFVVKILIPMK